MTRSRLAGLLLPAALALLLAGCGGTDAGATPADRALRSYFDDIATQTVSSLRSAAHAAAPGSPAAAYATYLAASTQAATEGGQHIDPSRKAADRTKGGFRFCQGSASDRVCFDYTMITRIHGLVSDFSINGKPVSNRLAVGDESQTRFAGVAAKAAFVAAYETTATGRFYVVVRITAGPDVTLAGVKASYRSPAGGESTSTATLGRARLGPGSSGNYLFAFSDATIGGTITVTASGGNGRQGSVALVTGSKPGS